MVGTGVGVGVVGTGVGAGVVGTGVVGDAFGVAVASGLAGVWLAGVGESVGAGKTGGTAPAGLAGTAAAARGLWTIDGVCPEAAFETAASASPVSASTPSMAPAPIRMPDGRLRRRARDGS